MSKPPVYLDSKNSLKFNAPNYFVTVPNTEHRYGRSGTASFDLVKAYELKNRLRDGFIYVDMTLKKYIVISYDEFMQLEATQTTSGFFIVKVKPFITANLNRFIPLETLGPKKDNKSDAAKNVLRSFNL